MTSHKVRLFIIATASVGLVLAVLFVGIVSVVRTQVLAHKEFEMRLAVRTTPVEEGAPFPVSAFRHTYPAYSVAVFDSNQRLLTSSGPLKPAPLEGFKEEDDHVELGVKRGGELIVVASGWTSVEQGLDALAVILAALWLPLTLVVGLATWFGAQSVFGHLDRLNQQAAAISGSNLKDRLAIQDRAEFGAFAGQLNQMLDRIEQTAAREEEFAGDAAHELRTPLAILRMRIETTLLNEREPGEYAKALRAMLLEIEHLTQIVESLLHSARGLSQAADPIDLEPLVLEGVARWEESYRDKGASIEATTEPGFAQILSEEVRIVLDNLLANALRFSPAGGKVGVDLRQANGRVVLSIQDAGPGIPEELRDKVFDRFFRAETSRNRKSGGAGVGLAVCKKIIESRGGSIRVVESKEGACFEATLPKAR